MMVGEVGAEVAAILRELSGRHMITSTELASVAGISQSQMSKVLRGLRPLQVDQLHAVADRLDSSASAILARAEDKH